MLTTLYMGPIAVALYVLADKEPRPGERERSVAPMWKQALGSTLHCVAGDATCGIIAATVTGLFGLPMWFGMTAEYVLGFIFQALFMKDMFGGSYTTALRGSFLPEWLSMNTMMAGMFPTMVYFMMGRDMKHGLMTVRRDPPSSDAPHAGHHGSDAAHTEHGAPAASATAGCSTARDT